MKEQPKAGEKANLQQGEALEKIKALVEDIDTCMLCTYSNGKLKSRPMSVRKIEDDGTLWFMSDKDSDKNREISLDKNVDLLFAGGHEKFLALHGSAEISTDRTKIKELWNPFLKIWFPDGEDDAAIGLVKVKFDDGYYWDTKHGHMVSLLKMAGSLITGTTHDDGVEGSLSEIRNS